MPEPATCNGCGLGCDDIEATVSGGSIDSLACTCPLGDAWFAERTSDLPPLARVDGRETGLDEALDAAATLLGSARMPLVHGLGQATIEAQREAVAIAEAIGGVLDPAGPVLDGAGGRAIQEVGVSTASLGEVRDRSRLVVVWREDPVTTQPRLLERLRLDRASRGDDRTLVVVDAQRTATAEEADTFVELPPELDFEALWVLRALVTGAPLGDAGAVPVPAFERLAGALRECVHGTLMHGGGLSAGPGGHMRALALLLLVRDLSHEAHVVAVPLRREGNALGAEDVLAWQTGYPSAVSFARGYPRSSPGEFSAAGLLERREADAALIVAWDPLGSLLPAPAAEGLRAIPTVVVDPRATATAAAARVAIAPAVGGIHHPGTAHRMDGVPLPLRAVLESARPADHEVLAGLAARLAPEPAEATA
jgi:formylmethanofuran dehydrogenase subunit B